MVRKIRCLSGHITVFRANDPTLMEAYRKALLGQVTDGERFTILCDDAPFQPADFFMVGFGERFGSSDSATVHDYLLSVGANGAEVQDLLALLGVADLATVTVGALSEPEARAVRLVAALISSDRVVVLNDPFAGLPSDRAQRAARLFVDFAWNRKAIVIVTKLSDRPIEWIENEVVQRVQLERPRQRTIGYGGDDDQTAALVRAVRADLGVGPSPAPDAEAETFTMLSPRSEALDLAALAKTSPRDRRLVIGGAVVAIVLVTLVGLMFDSPRGNEVSPTVETVATSGSGSAAPESVPTAAPASKLVLDRYPIEVRDAVNQAFNDPDAALRTDTGFRAESQKREIVAPSQIFVPPPPPPAYSNPPGAQGADVPPSLSADDEEAMNRRREEIRRRFLEAIQRQQGG